MSSRSIDHPDVVVVGGGIVGASTALQLCRLGATTVLVDDGRPGRASEAGAGILSPETTIHSDPSWLALAEVAGATYPELAESLDVPGGGGRDGGSGYERCGLLEVAVDPGEVAYLDELEARSAERRPGALQRLSPEEAREAYPLLGPVSAALHHSAAARVDGRRFAGALVEAATREGLTVLPGVVRALACRGERVIGVDLDDRRVSSEHVVLCAGAWTGLLLAPLGAGVPIAPMKGQIVHMASPELPDGCPIVQRLFGHYLVHWPGGRVACGGTLEPDAGFDTSPTVGGLAELAEGCRTLAPALSAARFLEVRVGLRPSTPDGAPVIDVVPGTDHLHICAGHGTDGLLLGPVSGLLTACRVTGADLPPELAAIDQSSFGSGRFDASARETPA